MPAIATSKFRVHNAEQFLEAFSETNDTKMYFYIGGPSAFQAPDSDVSPPTPTQDINSIEFEPWRDSIAAKRVTSNDVVHVIPRHNWTSGVTYDYYDDKDTNLLSDDFYVMNSEYNVYKCLFNGKNIANPTGAPVSEEPTGTLTTTFETTSDNYIWKYMYTISTTDALKFLTTDYMPCRTNTATVQPAAIDGGIHVIVVTNGGSGYTGAPTVTVSGDGSGCTATAVLNGDAVEYVEITPGNEGSGYTSATVSFSGGGGSNAAATAIISPKGGHGSNAVEELGGKYAMLNVRLDGSESGAVSTENDFRKVGLIRDPIDDDTGVIATGDVYRQTYRFEVENVAGTGTFAQDETLSVIAGSEATVIEWDSLNNYLYTTIPQPNPADFANGTAITSSGGGTCQIIGAAGVDAPGLRAYTGDILYIENRSPISRATDQIEDVKLIVEF